LAMDPKKVIVCRCENVTLEDVLKAIDEGFDNLELLKRKLRIGMGPCQGQTCLLLVAGILMRRTGKGLDEVLLPRNRPPITPVKMKYFAGGERS